MRKLLTVFVALIGLSFVAIEADARRMSGGKSIGKQREAINPNQAAPRAPAQQQQATPNTPAQQQAAPGAGAAAAQQPSGMSRWLGPLAGLAIGAGLASLFLNNGFAGALAGILLAAALAFGIFFLFRLLTRGRTQQAPLRYAGAGPQAARMPSAPVEPVFQRTSTSGAPAPHSVAATTTAAPAAAATARWAGFDEAEFVRHARMNFVNLQAAYDRNDMAAIRDFVTPELAADIEKDMRASGPGEKTDVVTLEAQVLDVATENGLYVVSVRFSGLMREGASEPQPFAELWHLEKPLDGRSGWVISGIQQA
jgi:predicted lipid-binding transport protein (Tim44 family)